MKARYAIPVMAAILFAGVLVCAQEPVKPAADVESLFKAASLREAATESKDLLSAGGEMNAERHSHGAAGSLAGIP